MLQAKRSIASLGVVPLPGGTREIRGSVTKTVYWSVVSNVHLATTTSLQHTSLVASKWVKIAMEIGD